MMLLLGEYSKNAETRQMWNLKKDYKNTTNYAVFNPMSIKIPPHANISIKI